MGFLCIFLLLNLLMTEMKTTPNHHPPKNEPQLFTSHTQAATTNTVVHKVCIRDLELRCCQGSRPLAHVRNESAGRWNCMRGGLDLHTCTHSPRDGDAHPICQHSEKHPPPLFPNTSHLPLCLHDLQANKIMSCEIMTGGLVMSQYMGQESGCALASAHNCHLVGPKPSKRVFAGRSSTNQKAASWYMLTHCKENWLKVKVGVRTGDRRWVPTKVCLCGN